MNKQNLVLQIRLTVTFYLKRTNFKLYNWYQFALLPAQAGKAVSN